MPKLSNKQKRIVIDYISVKFTVPFDKAHDKFNNMNQKERARILKEVSNAKAQKYGG